MYQINYQEMGERIYQRRKQLGLTQEKLAEKVDISPSYFGQIERGENQCSLTVIVNLATVLELNLDTLIRGVDQQNVDTALLEILDEIPRERQKEFVEMCGNLAKSFQ